MIPHFFPRVAWAALLAFVAISSVAVSAQAPASPAGAATDVDVVGVRFDNVRGGTGNWYEAQVELQTRAGAAVDNKRFINRVKVTFSLGTFGAKVPAGSKVPDTFYRASAEAVALEATGGRVVYRFYLPPEVVKRDALTGDQKFYLVEVSADGKPVPFNSKTHINDSAIANASALEGFRAAISSKAGVNDGILLPQHLTPFAFDNTRPSPTMIRSEVSR